MENQRVLAPACLVEFGSSGTVFGNEKKKTKHFSGSAVIDCVLLFIRTRLLFRSNFIKNILRGVPTRIHY